MTLDPIIAFALAGAVVTGTAGGLAHARKRNLGGGAAAVAGLWYAVVGLVAFPVLGALILVGLAAFRDYLER